MGKYKKMYKALRKEICGGQDVIHQEKVIHPCAGKPWQSYKVDVYIPDPLPKNYTSKDRERPRLTVEEALDRWVKRLVKLGG